jgi:hypothetical protein
MTKEREDKFVELAEKRVKNALNALRLIKNLANKSNYKYEDRDGVKITRVLMQEVQSVREAFRSGGRNLSDDFKLR